jgi:hypothetical protein
VIASSRPGAAEGELIMKQRNDEKDGNSDDVDALIASGGSAVALVSRLNHAIV